MVKIRVRPDRYKLAHENLRDHVQVAIFEDEHPYWHEGCYIVYKDGHPYATVNAKNWMPAETMEEELYY